MSEPVIELIAAELESRLEAVDVGNGYPMTLSVVRPTRLGTEVKDNQAIIVQEDPAPDEEVGPDGILSGNPPASCWVQNFKVTLLSRQSEADDAAAETLVNRLWAYTVKAVTRKGESDEATWHTFDGNAWNARILAPSMGVWESDRATAIIEFKVEVKYRTDENDPFTRR